MQSSILTDGYLIIHFSRRSRKEIQGPFAEAFPMLMSYDFPGNIRELENIIEDATVVWKNGMISIQNQPDHFTNPEEGRVKRARDSIHLSTSFLPMHFFRRDFATARWCR
jgi:transcriptional regulator with PAS, ATPase and Fis domain